MSPRHGPPEGRRGERADPGPRTRKPRDAALAVPLIGLILLMPPVAQIFAIDGRIAGIPVVLAYVFGVWLMLVAGARATGRRILETETAPEPRDGGGRDRDGDRGGAVR